MNEAELTREQEASLVHTLEEDPAMWLVLLTLYITSEAKEADDLTQGLLANTSRWQSLARDVKLWGFGELADMAYARTSLWKQWIDQLLTDPTQALLLNFFFRSLVARKNRRVADVGPRAQTQQRLQAIHAAIASEALVALDRYRHAAAMLASGKSVTIQAHTYYQTTLQETSSQIAALLGATVQLTEARTGEDIRQLQQFILRQLLEPLEVKVPGLPVNERKAAIEKAASYRRLMQAVQISFD